MEPNESEEKTQEEKSIDKGVKKNEDKSAKKSEDSSTTQEKKKRRRPGPPRRRAISKRCKENQSKISTNKQYPLKEAIELLKNSKGAKFDETVAITIKLGIDPKKSEQLLRGSVALPKGIGKTKKVLVFADGEFAEQARQAGADVVGDKDLVDKIQNENWVDFDIAIAHPNMMKFVGRLGKVLGPKGKMPSPKSGTVTQDIATAVKEFKGGRVEYRTDNSGNVHAPMGKKSFSVGDLIANTEAFLEHIKAAKPATAKGTYMQKVALACTMGPGAFIEWKN
jgi:large subunit ribosomal protein L1